MRRQYFYWAYLTLAIVLTAYGGYSFISNLVEGKDIPILGMVFFIIGILLLIFYLILFLMDFLKRKPRLEAEAKPVVEEAKEESAKEETIKEEPAKEGKIEAGASLKKDPRMRYEYTEKPKRNISQYDNDDYSVSAYVKKSGYGPVLEINGSIIRDMRTNDFYQISGNYVYGRGQSLLYEIYSNRIRSIGGRELFEISGGNLNKVFGGFFASVDGNSLTVYDLSERYEITNSLPTKTLLAVAVILFEER